MLGTNSYIRRNRTVGSPTNTCTGSNTGTFLARPRLLLRSYLRPKSYQNYSTYLDSASTVRSKRFKARKMNTYSKLDLNKRKSTDYTEMAYREAVSKLKYLLAESYTPCTPSRNRYYNRSSYRMSNMKLNESAEDTDDRSLISEFSRTKDSTNLSPSRKRNLSSPNPHEVLQSNKNVPLVSELESLPPEISSFIEKQEEYIEQLEQESQYCRDELSNLLGKVREVVAENEVLQNKSKSNFLKSVLGESKNLKNELNQTDNPENVESYIYESKQNKSYSNFNKPNIVYESRISELEAQLTQAKLELKKVQEENQINTKKLSESGLSLDSSELKIQLEQAMRAKYEAEAKMEEFQRTFAVIRDKEIEATQKAKRALDFVQHAEFEKNQAEAEIRRLKDELERQHDKVREATHEAVKRITDERQQAERRYSQQVEQLTADVAAHWESASKSQLETEKQRRELADLKRDLSQKQNQIDSLKKELQNKISILQSDLNQALTEKDAAEQEILAVKLAFERNERQSRQEQNRLQTEINSYRQRLERADADLVHCRRENLRLSEQIASLEKEISMTKITHPEETRASTTPRVENEKELTSMIMDLETKHESNIKGNMATDGTTPLPSNKKRTVKVDLKVKVIPKKKSGRLLSAKTPLSTQEEMAFLQSNIEYLSNKIQNTIDNQKIAQSIRPNNEHSNTYVYDNNSTDSNKHLLGTMQQEEYNQFGDEQLVSSNKPINEMDISQEYRLQREESNIQDKYPLTNQNFESYETEQNYEQYNQYNPQQYEEQQYAESNQYNSNETPNEMPFTGHIEGDTHNGAIIDEKFKQ